MATQRSDGTRANALAGQELATTVMQTSRAPAEAVWDVLADLPGHIGWAAGGGRFGGLTAMEAPAGVAAVGTEFTSTGEERLGRMTDRSVVTEADRPTVFEFVTESAMELKRSGKRSYWTVIHRYEIAPAPGGCTVSVSSRVARASTLPGPLAMFKIPVLRSIAKKETEKQAKRGLANLVRSAEERARTHGEEES